MNDYERKFDLATAELEYAGLQERGYPAPSLRILRAVGLKPKPDFYCSRVSRLIWTSLSSGGPWGVFVYLFVNIYSFYHFYTFLPSDQIPRLILTSIVFGVSIALLRERDISRGRRRHNLSRWEDL